jgi:hypothetical protein
VLTLLAYTVTTKQTFLAMNIFKIRFRNKIEDKFFTDSNLMMYIKKKIGKKLSINSIIKSILCIYLS